MFGRFLLLLPLSSAAYLTPCRLGTRRQHDIRIGSHGTPSAPRQRGAGCSPLLAGDVRQSQAMPQVDLLVNNNNRN